MGGTGRAGPVRSSGSSTLVSTVKEPFGKGRRYSWKRPEVTGSRARCYYAKCSSRWVGAPVYEVDETEGVGPVSRSRSVVLGGLFRTI